jgi:hypothetical protein
LLVIRSSSSWVANGIRVTRDDVACGAGMAGIAGHRVIVFLQENKTTETRQQASRSRS